MATTARRDEFAHTKRLDLVISYQPLKLEPDNAEQI